MTLLTAAKILMAAGCFSPEWDRGGSKILISDAVMHYCDKVCEAETELKRAKEEKAHAEKCEKVIADFEKAIEDAAPRGDGK